RTRRAFERARHGNAAFKIDYALSEPVPWRAAEAREAPTLHLGGDLRAIAAAERQVFRQQVPTSPFVLVGQQSLFDDTRAPAGQHTLWVYAPLPAHSTADLSGAVEAEIERQAPGFRDIILARQITAPA